MWYLVGIHPALRRHTTSHGTGQLQSRGRFEHLDTLRTFLTGLVIYHHVAIIYGGEGSWPYVEATKKNPLLMMITGIDQAFFMSTFFVISGYLSSASIRRAVAKANRLGQDRARVYCSFFKGKLLRLGVPAVVYSVFGHALTLAFAKNERFTWAFYKAYLSELRAAPGIRGPPWYCALLLIFDGIFAAHSALGLPALPVTRYTPPVLYALLPVFDMFWRRVAPLGWNFTPLGLHAAFLPRYTLSYFAGIFLNSNPQLVFPTESSWRTSPLPALALFLGYSAVLFPLTRHVLRDSSVLFGENRVAFAYIVFHELGFAALTHCALRAAHWCTDPAPRRPRVLPRLAYGAFLVHATLCTLVPVQLRDLQLGPLAKTAVVGSVCTAFSFMLSAVLVRLPVVKNII
ncbi:hypothetical protein AURDEDRAFT_188465 [Auricularia subglabra TFB-10046 SS5]|nr:hypothetical protein AURDEDRAFT_188465 [Auricularia subglabra TFB-10046 SS5]